LTSITLATVSKCLKPLKWRQWTALQLVRWRDR